MSRGFRSSTGNVAFGDDEPQRWDRDKFERMSRRAAPPDERDYLRYEEHERFSPRGAVRDVALEERVESRSPRGARFQERERYVEQERFAPPPRRRPDFMEEPIPAEVANRALAPYRRRSIVEREIDVPVRRPRPQYLRRQSSLDTFDRKPLPRYSDEYRLPADVAIPLPIRRPRSPPRRLREEVFEEVRYRDLQDREVDEYRDIRVRRERGGHHRSRSHAAASMRSASSSSSSFEDVAPTPAPAPAPSAVGKRGKTRMPKRLAHKKAIVELGYPFEEEDDFIIVQRALQKEHIDEIIEKSKGYREEKTIYKYTAETEKVAEKKVEKKEEKAEAKKEEKKEEAEKKEEKKEEKAEEKNEEHRAGETIVKTTTTIENIPAPPGSHRSPSPTPTVASHRTHRSHHPRTEFVEERIVEESNHIGGPLTIVMPDRGRHAPSDGDIRREIKALEAERRALKLEREADERRYQATLIRESDYEIIERERPRERSVVRVEKDRKGRLALVKSAH